MSNVVSHQSTRESRRGKFNLANVARMGALALVLGAGSLGLAGTASAHELNPNSTLLDGHHTSERAVCWVDGKMVYWHPPMAWSGSDCFDYQPLPSGISAHPVFKPTSQTDLSGRTSEAMPATD